MHNGVIDYLVFKWKKMKSEKAPHLLSLSKDKLVEIQGCTLEMDIPNIDLFLLLEAGLCRFHKVSHLCIPKMAKNRRSPF